jgi:hypothetical protein
VPILILTSASSMGGAASGKRRTARRWIAGPFSDQIRELSPVTIKDV